MQPDDNPPVPSLEMQRGIGNVMKKYSMQNFNDALDNLINNPSKKTFIAFLRIAGEAPGDCPLCRYLSNVRRLDIPCSFKDLDCPMGLNSNTHEFVCAPSSINLIPLSRVVTKAIELKAFLETIK